MVRHDALRPPGRCNPVVCSCIYCFTGRLGAALCHHYLTQVACCCALAGLMSLRASGQATRDIRVPLSSSDALTGTLAPRGQAHLVISLRSVQSGSQLGSHCCCLGIAPHRSISEQWSNNVQPILTSFIHSLSDLSANAPHADIGHVGLKVRLSLVLRLTNSIAGDTARAASTATFLTSLTTNAVLAAVQLVAWILLRRVIRAV